MEGVGEKNKGKRRGAAAKAIAFKELEFFHQTLVFSYQAPDFALGFLYFPCILGIPVEVSCVAVLPSFALPGGWC